MSFGNNLRNIGTILSKNKVPVLIFLVAILLRLYRLEDFTVFLSDQGRDAIIIKRIAMLQDFPLIGAPTSIGQVFLGPLFYYLMAPFLLLTGLYPIGMSYGVALLSITGILITYLLLRKELDKLTALFFLLFVSFSFTQIEFARFSWNPNLLPISSFLAYYCFYKWVTTKKYLYSALFGALLCASILHFHYLALLVLAPIALFFLEQFFAQKHKLELLKHVGVSILSFIALASPLIVFDLRHQFLNSINFIKLFTHNELTATSPWFIRLLETTQAFYKSSIGVEVSQYASLLLTLGFVALCFFILRKDKHFSFFRLNLYVFALYILLFSVLSSARHPHYFASIYYSFYLLLAAILSKTRINLMSRYLVIPILLISFLIINVKHYYYFKGTGWSQIAHSKRVAEFIATKLTAKRFNFATWPIDFGEDNYLYFLELKGYEPADRYKAEVTDQMIVICNKEPCLVENSPSWNISMFGKAKIDKMWEYEGIKIYRLIHEK